MNKTKLLKVAKGEIKADIVLKNAQLINVFTKDIESGNLAISDGIIIGVGNYKGEIEYDYSGYFLAPGFIDGHVHIESSMLIPPYYAQAVLPRGTTSVVADCHEIANVLGIKGIDFMLEASENIPLDVFMMIPSCVPSTKYETSGAVLKAQDLKKYVDNDRVYGLGEMMDYPGAINGEKEVLKKIDAFAHKTIDGHAPLIMEKDLNAYVLSGVKTDHECTVPEELIEKVKRGMYIHLREGSQTKNIVDLLPGVNPSIYQRILFCSDDLHPSDIKKTGHIDNNINIAIKSGIPPVEAISMATINIANCYRLKDVGAIAPGYKADLVAFKDINNIEIIDVFKAGNLVVKNKKTCFKVKEVDTMKVEDTVKINLASVNLAFNLKSNYIKVIGLIKNNVTTKMLEETVKLNQGRFLPKENPGLLKLVVLERHKLSGNIGKAIVRGYGLKNGALALTIAHDSHNLICIGDNNPDMLKAIFTIKDIGGGIVLVSEGKVIETLPLEVGGLMSKKPQEFVIERLESLESNLKKLGVNHEIEDPILQLAFLSLPVIPELKLTDMGLFDVRKFKITSIEVGEDS
ncbi:MAG: adenine deaminase [Candidatus Izemoplasmatales bacterium]